MKNRAYRRAQKERVIKKRLKLVKIEVKSPNKLSKQHPFDCGQPKCLCCHYEKVLRKKKARDRKLEIKVKQQLKEDLGDLL